MIITRQFAGRIDGDSPAHDPFTRSRLAHWRDDNAVLCASTRRAEFPPLASPLSIKTITNGSATMVRDGRRYVADDDHYTVFNDGEVYTTVIHGDRPVHAFCVYFRPGLHEEVAAGLRHDLDTVLARGPLRERLPMAFSPHLRAHDHAVTPLLAEVRANVVAGRTEPDWFEEKFQQLLVALIDADRNHRRLADRMRAAKPSTRRELLRRIGWATDFINSNYMEPITLDDMARAAHLSKFHLARLFKVVLGITPHNYLQRKRTQVARRLVDGSDLDLAEVALAAGFGSRWTMYRFLRKSFGSGGRELRSGDAAAARGASAA